MAAALVEWQRLRSPEAVISFAEIEAFLEAHPDWPGRAALLRRAEELMPEAWPDRAARAWFDRFPPRTGPGKQRLAEALIADGETDAGIRLLREAWIDGDFPRDLERRFLKRHRNALGAEDHNRRLDRLLWDERADAARRQLRRAGKAERRLGEARLRLMQRRRGVDWAIRQVPDRLRSHPGLVFERIRWRRLAGKHAGARELLLDRPAELVRSGKWWPEQSYQIREAIERRLFGRAYAIASRHGQTANRPFSEAEWLAGWLALRFLNRPGDAGKHFQAMYDRVRFPISRARAAYWSARAAETAGDRDRATEWYRRASGHPTTFYGQLAGKTLALQRRFPGSAPAIAPEERERFEARPLVRAARLLGEAGDFETMRTFVTHLSRSAQTPGEHLLVSRLGLAYGAPHISVSAAKRAWRNGVPLIAEAYPLAFGKADTARAPDAPELALLLGLARQESEMDPHARSRSGAVGLMQLLPGTAREVSRGLGLAYSRSRLREDRGYNITLGSAYLAELLEAFEGDRALALAAYNAGPNRVRQWLRIFGDPRRGEVDPIDWMELVPFAETRNYIQRVFESAAVYRHRLQGPSGSASAPAAVRTAAID
ncbi:MAG: lytic transglycosylase domain-containing protein [Alphaproteobacteria bacterium]|nr:lytic transglycosylase domain-containing protein [Alphaproteobacteria bacterium]